MSRSSGREARIVAALGQATVLAYGQTGSGKTYTMAPPASYACILPCLPIPILSV